MKKSILSIIAIALFGVIAFSSCEKTSTRADMLTVEKGWVLEAATCPEGYGANNVTDLMEMFTNGGGYENDDIIKFQAEGNKQYINAGATRYDFEGEGDYYVGTWELNEDETVLSCQLPMFKAAEGAPETEIYSAAKEECNIISMDKDKMVLSHTFTVAPGNAKWQAGTWTFQFTYVRAK